MTELTDLVQYADSLDLPVVKHEFLSVIHKLQHPMREIFAKVPGESLAARARAVGVSRQTVYVWLDERFRPVGPQAKKLAKLTGVPVEHIKEYQNDAGRKVAKKAATLAKRGGTASRGDGGGADRPRKRRVVDAQAGSGTVRARGKRASG